MNIDEYSDYVPRYPQLIPKDEAEASERLTSLVEIGDEVTADETSFLNGWWALFWINPGLHPDDWSEWDGEFSQYKYLAAEAFRRFEAGMITDGQLYPADATHNRLWQDQLKIADGESIPPEKGDKVVLIRNSEGLYLSKTGEGEIGWVGERYKAFRYYRKADAVDAQIKEVKRRYNQTWTIELSDPRGDDLKGMKVLVVTGANSGEPGVCVGSYSEGKWGVKINSTSEVLELAFEEEFVLADQMS